MHCTYSKSEINLMSVAYVSQLACFTVLWSGGYACFCSLHGAIYFLVVLVVLLVVLFLLFLSNS